MLNEIEVITACISISPVVGAGPDTDTVLQNLGEYVPPLDVKYTCSTFRPKVANDKLLSKG
jgi:hypothetical protein